MFKLADVRPELPHAPQLALRAATTILLVDDDSLVRTTLRAVLTYAGFGVLACEDGPTALSLYSVRPNIDVLLTDFQMPHMTGFALAKELTRRSPWLPVVLVSGTEPDELPLSEIERHHWSFLPKPINRQTLLATLDGFCCKPREHGLGA